MTNQKDTQHLVLATREELATMSAEDVLRRLDSFLIGHLAAHNALLPRYDSDAPEKREFFRGIARGTEFVSVVVAATIFHGYDS